MSEIIFLTFFLCIGFVLAPLMTNHFFLNSSKLYSDIHKLSIIALLAGFLLNANSSAVIWLLFCIFGFVLYLNQERAFIFSFKGLAGCIPFIFSLISSVWFVAGANNLHLLGYNPVWSFYAALHGIFLGWLLIGCLAFLSKRTHSDKVYLLGSYLSFILFLFVAFGIDGMPYIKRVGVVGFSMVVPFLLGLYAFRIKKGNAVSLFLSVLAFLTIAVSMALAILNEFWADAPRSIFGISTMVLTHGFLNAIITVPCFFLAIRLEGREHAKAMQDDGVIFFDGFCVLCSGTVSYLLKIDKNRTLKYSALQGKYAQETLDRHHIDSSASVLFRCEGTLYERGEAVVHILKKLGGIHRFIGMVLIMLPVFTLNCLYDFIARHRYRIFGRNDKCLVPTDENRTLFIP